MSTSDFPDQPVVASITLQLIIVAVAVEPLVVTFAAIQVVIGIGG